MADIDVGADNWEGSASGTFNWNNTTNTAASITQNGSNTWPFTSGPPISVSGGAKQSCQLIGTSGSYSYKSNGNPRTVVIT